MMNRHIEEIAGTYGIFVIYLFGSQAEEGKRYLDGEDVTPDAFSDLDVSVAFKTPPDEIIKTYGELYKEISDIFDPFNIDLIFMHEVNSLFQYEIIKGIRIYEQDVNQADELEEGIMKKAEDLFFRKQTFDKDVMEAIEDGYFEFEYSPNS
ncbi:MAG: nucleotidyltransferase domain-containing protein [Nitrospira sp.]|nr:nucleotidyltransferase domain-containing protein [Nitrospira sp.]